MKKDKSRPLYGKGNMFKELQRDSKILPATKNNGRPYIIINVNINKPNTKGIFFSQLFARCIKLKEKI